MPLAGNMYVCFTTCLPRVSKLFVVSFLLRLAFLRAPLRASVYCGNQRYEMYYISPEAVNLTKNTGRTLEETAALFDGERPEHELMQLGGQAATMTFNLSKGVVTPDRRLGKSVDYTRDIYLQSYGMTSRSDSDTESRRQSQESDMAITI